jgi:hypothetical protein
MFLLLDLRARLTKVCFGSLSFSGCDGIRVRDTRKNWAIPFMSASNQLSISLTVNIRISTSTSMHKFS